MTPPPAAAVRPQLHGTARHIVHLPTPADARATAHLPTHADACHIVRPRTRGAARTAVLRRRGLVCAGALLAGALLGCGGAATQEVETVDKVPVVTRPAVRGTIRPLVVASGTVRPAAGAELLVTAPQAARIAEMPRGVGDAVAKGALLVRFDIPSLAVDASDRRSALASAEARLTNSRAAAERIRGLFQRGIAARKELEDAERELADAEAALAAARTAREASGELAARAVVRAPFSGVVAARAHNPGDLVDPSAAEPILRLVDPGRLQVEAAVALADLAAVTVGSPATVVGPGAYPAEPATVLTRPAAVDSTTGAATVRLAFTAPNRLPAGTPVRLEIRGEPHPGALLVPAEALVAEGTESFLFTVDAQGKAHRHAVRVGIVAGDLAEILSGVTAGEAVVVSGQNALPDGAATQPAAPPAEPSDPATPAGSADPSDPAAATNPAAAANPAAATNPAAAADPAVQAVQAAPHPAAPVAPAAPPKPVGGGRGKS